MDTVKEITGPPIWQVNPISGFTIVEILVASAIVSVISLALKSQQACSLNIVDAAYLPVRSFDPSIANPSLTVLKLKTGNATKTVDIAVQGQPIDSSNPNIVIDSMIFSGMIEISAGTKTQYLGFLKLR